MTKQEIPKIEWTYGSIPLARDKTYDKVVGLTNREPRAKVLDIPTGTGILSDRLRKMGFGVSCCDINPTFFSVPDLRVEIGDLNQSLPYADNSFDYLICLEGMEHTENPSNAIREFQKILEKGGKIFISTPNILNIEHKIRFFFTGTFSKIPFHEVVKNIWKADLCMAHLSRLGYPLLKFIIEWFGLRIQRLEKDQPKRKMVWLLPFVWLIRLYGRMASNKRREAYRLDETLSNEIIMGGDTLIIVGEKRV